MSRIPNAVSCSWDFRFKKKYSKNVVVLFEAVNIINWDVQRAEAVEDADAGRLQPAQQQQGQAQERG